MIKVVPPERRCLCVNGIVNQEDLTMAVKYVSEFPFMQKYAKGGKVEKVMREHKEGKLHSGSKKGPLVKSRKQAVAIALSEGRKPVKKAMGGEVDNYGNKKEPFRGSPKKARELGRRDRMDRMALAKMRKAEKYAPGLSVDMPDKRAKGGMPVHKAKPMYGGGKC